MITVPDNITLVNLCAAIYSHSVNAGDWDYLDLGLDDGVFWGLKKVNGCNIIVFRGSITALDWIRDALAAPILTKVGWVHSGFYIGMEKMLTELLTKLDGSPVAVTGHSLGAAHADICCALLIQAGIIPVVRMVVGEPNPGMADFCKILDVIPNQYSFMNGAGHRHDIVTDVPFTIPPALPFCRPTPKIEVTALPTGNDFEVYGDAFAWHHIALYQDAVTTYEKEKEKV